MGRIRILATSRDGARVAVGAYDNRVAVWDIVHGEKVCEFETVLGFPGDLGITPNGRLVVAGQYGARGAGCYDAETGDALWIRRELKRFEHISIVPDGTRAYCGFNEGSGRVVDMETGETLEKLRGIRQVFVSPFGDAAVLSGHGQRIARLDDGRTVAKLKPDNIFGCGFAPGLVMLSGVRAFEPSDRTPWIHMRWCVDVRTGHEIWRHEWTDPVSTLGRGYDERDSVFLALESRVGQGRPHTLLRVDPGTGKAVDRVALPEAAWEIGFCSKGAEMLCPDGSIVDVSSGKTLRKLDFAEVSDANTERRGDPGEGR